MKPGDAYPEILKVIIGAIEEHYSWPRRYRFAAPKGCGLTLANIINSPSKLKEKFREELTKPKSTLAKRLGECSMDEVLAYVDGADFSVFGTVELEDLIEQHSSTRWHSMRFGTELPERPASQEPSIIPTEDEQRYIEQLIQAYREQSTGSEILPSNIAQHPHHGRHYTRQRVAFYSAESLRLFARDTVPEKTFENLQNQIYDGVIECHDREHKDGLERLYQVTKSALDLALTANKLLPAVEPRDRTGICHQLANVNRLVWCNADTE